MDDRLRLDISAPDTKVQHHDKILLLGSCFTEHISSRMEQGGMQVLANPNGLLFNPQSVVQSLQSYLQRKTYFPDELFLQNEIWNNWDFHSRFSGTDLEHTLEQMNESVATAADFLPETNWLIITLGSAFQYCTTSTAATSEVGRTVSNCHRAPAAWFQKQLLSVNTIVTELQTVLSEIQQRFPQLRIAFTISPVRHIRDGVVENNRSKARLIEAVHQLCEQLPHCFYFPAYELVIDVLRDHRYYDADLVHPNYAATQYVWEQFVLHWMNLLTQEILPLFAELNQAKRHRPRFPDTKAHKKFRESYYQKAKQLQIDYPYTRLSDTINYFAP